MMSAAAKYLWRVGITENMGVLFAVIGFDHVKDGYFRKKEVEAQASFVSDFCQAATDELAAQEKTETGPWEQIVRDRAMSDIERAQYVIKNLRRAESNIGSWIFQRTSISSDLLFLVLEDVMRSTQGAGLLVTPETQISAAGCHSNDESKA